MSAGNIIVRGGNLIDGTGAGARRADLRVRGGRIVEIGAGLKADGEQQIDASGAFVTPGFIDIHTHFDAGLFWDPCADPEPQHGVTSVLMGNCSLSLAPSTPKIRKTLGQIFSHIEDIPEPLFEQVVPWDWQSFGEYRKSLQRRGLGIHVGCLVGHMPLRLAVMGDAAWVRAANDAERTQLAELLDASLSQGAFGLSTSFFDEDGFKRPVPSRLADDAELEALFAVLERRRAMLEFIPDVNGARPRDDIDRVARLTRGRAICSTWNTVAYYEQKPERGQRVLDYASQLQASGVAMFPQVTPRQFDFQVNWDGGMAFMKFPESWHHFVQADGAAKRRFLTDESWRAVARREWDSIRSGMVAAHAPEKIRLISVNDVALERWIGRSLADLGAERGGHLSDVLADWLLENDLKAGVVSVGVSNADPDGVAALLNHPAAVVGAGDAGAHLQMMCATGDTTLLLTRHVRERGDFTLERAVWQITGRPAELFGFRGRGRLAVGYAADLAIFELDRLQWLPEVHVRDLPLGGGRLRRPEGGYRYTIANGEIIQQEGQLTGARPGRMLSGPGTAEQHEDDLSQRAA